MTITGTQTGATMPTDETAADEVTGELRLPDDLGSPRLLVELTEAAHAALRAAQQGWVAHLEAGPGEDESGLRYEDPSMSRVAAQAAATAIVERLAAVEFARTARSAASVTTSAGVWDPETRKGAEREVRNVFSGL